MALPYDTRIGSLASILPTSRRTSGTAACAEPPSNNGSLNNVTEAAAPAVARKCRRVTCFFILSSLREPDRDSRRLPIRCTHSPLSYVIVRPRSSSLHRRASRVSKVPFLNFPCSTFIRLNFMHHVVPPSPVASVDCAYFPSPRGCIYPYVLQTSLRLWPI